MKNHKNTHGGGDHGEAVESDGYIVEVEEVVAAGTIEPDNVITPGIFVDLLVKGR